MRKNDRREERERDEYIGKIMKKKTCVYCIWRRQLRQSTPTNTHRHHVQTTSDTQEHCFTFIVIIIIIVETVLTIVVRNKKKNEELRETEKEKHYNKTNRETNTMSMESKMVR